MRKLNKGSALLITLMVMVVLSLTGISFIFLADTENAISNNYYKAMSTLMAGQTGVYLVNSWFNSPTVTGTLVPAIAEMTFHVRTEAHNAPPASGGVDTTYKNSGVGTGNIPFEKPYLGQANTATVIDRFFGTEEFPDITIRITANVDQRKYLQRLNGALLGVTYENGAATVPQNGGVQIREIRMYSAPCSPYPDIPTNEYNSVYGICTVYIESENVNPAGQTVSTRRVRGIITDINYSVAGEALDVDGIIDVNGSVRPHWGNIKSTSSIDDNNVNFAPKGGPYYVSERGQVGYCPTLMEAYDGTAHWEPGAGVNGTIIEDPALLVRSKGDLNYSKHGLNVTCGTTTWPMMAMAGQLIPNNPIDNGTNPLNKSCDYYYDPTPGVENQFMKSYWKCFDCTGDPADPPCSPPVTPAQCANVTVPTYNPAVFYNYWGCDPTVAFATAFRGYTYWKRVVIAATQQGGGASNQSVHYLVPGGATAVNGLCASGEWGPPGSTTECADFETWTSGNEGFWFFDTTDGLIPKKDRSNLTGEQDVKGKYWSKGFVYLCATGFTTSGGQDGSFTVRFPGEPLWENKDMEFKDLVNGLYDAKVFRNGNPIFVDRFINLVYPARPYGANMNQVSPFTVNDNYEDIGRHIGKGWDKYGPKVSELEGCFHGIFYVTGDLRGTGSRAFWGSVMVWNGQSRISGTCDIWYDPELKEGKTQLGMPNSYIEQILTDM
jgi:hypothetical protein